MPEIVILNLNSGDNQEDLINKINQNFDSIVASGGGPQGPDGPPGDQGPIGPAGGKGDQGVPGERGTRWFVSSTNPSIGATSGSQILIGDYWVDTSNNKEVYVYATGGFIDTGTSLQAEDVFVTLPSIVGPSGVTTKSAIVQASPFPDAGTFVLSDSSLGANSANPNYAKFLITTNSTDGYPLLEFGKSNSPNVGLASDYTKHPFFAWKSASTSDYGIKFVVPGDSLDILAGGNLNLQSTNGNVNISGITSTYSATTSISFISGSSFTLNSGSSPLSISSGQFTLNNTSAFFTVPVSISGTFIGSYMFNLTNSPSGGTGGGIYVNLTGSASSDRYLFNSTVSGSTSRFYVRSDGKVKFDKTNYAYSTFAPASPTYATGGINYYSVGPNVVTNGNKVILSVSAGSNNGVTVPLYASGGWSDNYLGIGESISLTVFSGATGNTFSRINSTFTGATASPQIATLSSPTSTVHLNIMRTASNSWSVFYDTPSTSGQLQ